jgi:hypothetical protein
MWRSNPVCFCSLVATILLALSPTPRASAQGLQSTLRAGARVFPSVGPGVAALKRDSAGRYYILARPATTVSLYDAAGRLVGQIPNANSRGVTIHYAVDIDVDSTDRVFVVDRGANAIKIFAADGSPIATIPVNAPTSVVALSGGQFAVTTLLSRRLVQIMDENGKVIRTFGDPADVAPAPPPAQTQDAFAPKTPPQPVLVDRGRITSDSAGNIYFSYSSLPDPTLQRFDRYGYSAYESVVPKETFGSQQRDNGRVEVGYSMSALGWPTSFSAWTDLHSLSSLSMSDRARRGQRGAAAEASSSGSSSSSAADAPFGNVTTQGNVLDFTAGASPDALDLGDNFTGAVNSSDLNSSDPGLVMMPGMFGMGIGGFFHGHMPGLFEHPGDGEGQGPDAAAGSHPDFGGDHPGGEPGRDGFHFHPGFDEYRARVAVRVRLDSPPPSADGKPFIAAVGVDPVTHEVWAAIGDTLVHFDSGGAREDMYYLVLTDGTSLKPTSILVEPDRLLVATDPWGIYEFPRPDKPSAAPAANVAPVAAPASNAIIPQQIAPSQVAPAPKPHRQPQSLAPTPAPQP